MVEYLEGHALLYVYQSGFRVALLKATEDILGVFEKRRVDVQKQITQFLGIISG